LEFAQAEGAGHNVSRLKVLRIRILTIPRQCLAYPIGSNCGSAAGTISFMGGQELANSKGRWSVGQILLLLLRISLFLWGAAAKVAMGSGAPHVAEQGPDDVRSAAVAFNAMTAKVTRTMESQRHLLSAVGHDLRTPLTAMRINLEFVEDDDLRDGLMHNLEELQILTEQVLAAAKGAGGEPPRQVDLSALVESLVTDLDELGEPVSWANHAPAPISCRPNEIKRAVRNLVENAVAYGHRADVRISDTGDGYEVLVEDEGPGIPEDDRQRVFEPFVRLESSRNVATGGTGLGLTLAKAIAEGHGGAVQLENRPGGGLCARMRLPRVPVSAAAGA